MQTLRLQRTRIVPNPESSPSSRIAAWIALAGILFSFSVLFAALFDPSPAFAAPSSAKSYYISSYSSSWAYDRGCDLGKQDLNASGTQMHVAILDFGTMYQSSSGTWKVNPYAGAADFSLASARVMAEQLGRGYWNCTGSDTSSYLYVGMGTNNSGGSVTSSAGAAMAAQAYLGANHVYDNGWRQATIIGANDFEAFGGSSSSATKARAWVSGYNNASSRPILVNYGSADGCPTSAVPSSTSCSAGLPAESIWYVSWSGVAYPLPEIYTTNSAQAKQWKYLSLYSYLHHNSKFIFKGVMTQSGACSQKGGCSGTNNSASTGWDQLNDAVDSDSRTATNPDGPTDIRWK